MLLPIERKTQEIAVDIPALDDLTRNRLHLAVYFLLRGVHIPLKGCRLAIGHMLVRFDHVASRVVNANSSVIRTAAVLCVTDCIRDLFVPQATERQRIGD
jgi:hypothetical protein